MAIIQVYLYNIMFKLGPQYGGPYGHYAEVVVSSDLTVVAKNNRKLSSNFYSKNRKKLIEETLFLDQVIRCSNPTRNPVLVPRQVVVGARGRGQHGEGEREELVRGPTDAQEQLRLLLLISLSDDGRTGKIYLYIFGPYKS